MQGTSVHFMIRYGFRENPRVNVNVYADVYRSDLIHSPSARIVSKMGGDCIILASSPTIRHYVILCQSMKHSVRIHGQFLVAFCVDSMHTWLLPNALFRARQDGKLLASAKCTFSSSARWKAMTFRSVFNS